MPIWTRVSGLSEVEISDREMNTKNTGVPLPATQTGMRPVVKYRQSRLLGAVRQLARTRGAGFGLGVLLLIIAMALFAPSLAPYERVSLQVGIISVGLALALGIPGGLLAGFIGGRIDDLLMRIIDAIWSFPTMILALAVGTAFGAGLTSSFIAVGVVFAPTVTRLVRAQTLSIRELDYVLAARAMGAKPSRIMWQHVWPNVASPVIVQASILVAAAIILEAGLSFLGLGVQPPTPAWGSMLRAGYPFLLTSLWPSVFPGLAIFITVLAFNLLGDGLQQALDPQLRRAKKI